MNLLGAPRIAMPMYRAFSTVAGPNHGEDHHPGKTVCSDDSTLLLLNKFFVYQMCRFPFFVKNVRKLTDVASKVLSNQQTDF